MNYVEEILSQSQTKSVIQICSPFKILFLFLPSSRIYYSKQYLEYALLKFLPRLQDLRGIIFPRTEVRIKFASPSESPHSFHRFLIYVANFYLRGSTSDACFSKFYEFYECFHGNVMAKRAEPSCGRRVVYVCGYKNQDGAEPRVLFKSVQWNELQSRDGV